MIFDLEWKIKPVPFQKYEEAEVRYGKPMAQLLADLLNQHGTLMEVSRVLNVRVETVIEWIKRAGCRTVTRIECADAMTRPAASEAGRE